MHHYGRHGATRRLDTTLLLLAGIVAALLALVLIGAAAADQAPSSSSSPTASSAKSARYCWTSRTAKHPRTYCSKHPRHTPARSTLEQFRARYGGAA